MSKRTAIIASDGLPARNNGSWAREKLSFLDEFIPPALQATERKRDRIYVDLFAGPGKNVDGSATGDEFDGSAIRALTARAPNKKAASFTGAKLVNLSKDDNAALAHRIRVLSDRNALSIPFTQIEFLNGDANRLVHRVMNSIDPQAYVFVIADIEAPKQLKWDTVRALRDHGHSSVDAFILFPLDMALNRMLSYKRSTVEQSSEVLTSFFGSEAWRPLVEGRITNAQSAELRRAVLELYTSGLNALGWSHVFVVRDVRRTGDRGLYKMIYASNHPAGNNIAAWSAKRPKRQGQLEIF